MLAMPPPLTATLLQDPSVPSPRPLWTKERGVGVLLQRRTTSSDNEFVRAQRYEKIRQANNGWLEVVPNVVLAV